MEIKMAPGLFLVILLVCPMVFSIDKGVNIENVKLKNGAEVRIEVNTSKPISGSVKKDLNTINQTTTKTQNVVEENVPEKTSAEVESGTVIRGVLVFAGLSLVFFIYVGFKTYRRRNSMPIVRKYGVRGRRSDVEMRPLPLDDDEEDETVFDVGRLNKS